MSLIGCWYAVYREMTGTTPEQAWREGRGNADAAYRAMREAKRRTGANEPS